MIKIINLLMDLQLQKFRIMNPIGIFHNMIS
nr:MAG TPA: hypothetical protein [Caudoviricetes sp.]